jgi:hypothetical protein
MKTGHIVTDFPELYAEDIASSDLALTAGKEIPEDAKYIFYDAAPGTEYMRMAKQLHNADCLELITTSCRVKNAYKGRYAGAKGLHLIDELPVPSTRELLDDVVMPLCYYGDSPARRYAVQKGLEQLSRMTFLPRIVFAELHKGEELFRKQIEAIPGATYLPLVEGPQHQHLMQKECLYQIIEDFVVTVGPRPQVWAFFDADCSPSDPEYVKRLRDFVLEHPDSMVQAWKHLVDSGPGSVLRVSYASRFVSGDDNYGSPGFAWVFADSLWQKMSGWNRWGVVGSGDCFLLYEYHDKCVYSSRLLEVPAYAHIVRKDLPRHPVLCMDAFMYHWHHGPINRQGKTPGRGYGYRESLINLWGVDAIPNHIEIDAEGLLAWKDPKCAMHYAVARKGLVESMADAIAMAEESRRATGSWE